MTVLWILRTALFLISSIIPLLHPATVVSYDASSAFLWLAVIPLEMAAAYFVKTKRTGYIFFLVPLILAALFFTRFDSYTWAVLAFGTGAYVFTFFQFRYKAFILGFIEASFLAARAYKLLLFSRASEDIASSSSLSAKLLFIAILGLYAAHIYIAYLIAFRKTGSKDCRIEHLSFVSILTVLILVVGVLLPSDFVEHSIVLNNLLKEPKPKPIDPGDMHDGLTDGNLPAGNQSGSKNGGNEEQNKGSLEGIPSERWEGGDGGGNDMPQYAIMIVASEMDNVFAAGAYAGTLDPTHGFQISESETLNELIHKRLLETWINPNPDRDWLRKESEVDIFSTLPNRYLAYRPLTVIPTVYDGTYFPFVYSYKGTSNFSLSTPDQWVLTPQLTEQEKLEFAEYLELPLDEQSIEKYGNLVDSWVGTTEGYYARIKALMEGFAEYQYQLGFNDTMSLHAVEQFLFETKNGDCSEFSNSLALLARFIGVPSRVVTGYLASSGLQTKHHKEGLEMLRQSIPILQKYDINSLYLVTTAHRHSWTQLYFPRFGWIDIESTQTALPPKMGQDANEGRVIIPLIEAKKNIHRRGDFQWAVFFKIIFTLAGLCIISAYVYKIGRRIYLISVSKKNTDAGLRCLLLLLLVQMADSGYKLKKPSETMREYAEQYKALSDFAELYSMLRYKTSYTEEENLDLWASLRTMYTHTLKSLRVKGLTQKIRRMFSLRGLYY